MKAGFTTVELMVTLFVAVIFLAGGFQLYQVVLWRNSQIRHTAEASNIGYSILRDNDRYIGNAQPCTSGSSDTIVPVPPSDIATLPPPVVVTLSRCRPLANPAIVKVSVKVTFGPNREEVQHAVYISS